MQNEKENINDFLVRKPNDVLLCCITPSTIDDWARANSGLGKVNQIKSIPLQSVMPEGRSIFFTRWEIKIKGSQRSSNELNVVLNHPNSTNVCFHTPFDDKTADARAILVFVFILFF